MIQTKLHKAAEYACDEITLTFVKQAQNLPHYVIDDGLQDMIWEMDRDTRDGLVSKAIAEDAYHLPFPRMLIEVPNLTPDGVVTHLLVIVSERHQGEKQVFSARVAMVDQKDEGFGVEDVSYDMLPRPDGSWDARQMGEGKVDATPAVKEELVRKTSFLMAAITAISVGPRIRGVATETSRAPVNLNKARAAKGKPPIREFTVMKIGRVYDSNGKEHAYTGRTMPVHLRAGHSRRQHYGCGNELVKTIYVQPTIVNFDPNAEVKMPKRILTA